MMSAEIEREPERPEVPAVPELPSPPPLTPRLPDMSGSPSKRAEEMRRFGLAYTIPTALIAPVVVLTLLGAWIDGRVGHASSGFTIGGAVIGLIVGLMNMLRMAAKLNG